MQLVSDNRAAIPRDRILRLDGVETLTGLKKSTIYRLQREGKFVQAVRITPRCVGWSEQAVLAWVQERLSASAQQSLAGMGAAK